MKLFFVILCAFALSKSFANARNNGTKNDRNFDIAYAMSSILERTAFSRILDETFNFTGRPKYIGHSLPIDYQLFTMMEETIVQLPPDVTERIVDMLKSELKHQMPMMEKYAKPFVKGVLKAMKTDLSVLFGRVRYAIEHIDAYMNNPNATAHKLVLHNIGRNLKKLNEYARSKHLTSHKTTLLQTISAVLEMWEKLPRIHHMQRNFCKVAMDPRMTMIIDTISLSKEVFPMNFHFTKRYIHEHMRKAIIRSFLRAPPVERMLQHAQAVLSNDTISAVKRFFSRYGTKLVEVQLRIMSALIFRPKGTFTRLEDFVPYVRGLIPIFNRLPRNVRLMIAGFQQMDQETLNIETVFEKMKTPGALKKKCLVTFKHLPEEIIEKLHARQNFTTDAESYCQFIELQNRHIFQMAEHLPRVLRHLGRMVQIPKEYLKIIMETFAPGKVHFIGCCGLNHRNPNTYYKELLSKAAWHKMKATTVRNADSLFPNVRRRVPILTGAVFGANACRPSREPK